VPRFYDAAVIRRAGSGAEVKSSRIVAVAMLAIATIVGTATPALAGTGATVADAQPWHYWIAPVLFLSALGVVFVALPLGYYVKVWRLKHPRR
jgi:hypothetical protein